MSIRASLYLLMAASLVFVTAWSHAKADQPLETPVAEETAEAPSTEPVDLFDAIDEGLVEVKFIAKSDARGRLIVENKAANELNLRVPEAFVGVPVLAQRGGGGFGGGGGGGQAVGGGGGGIGGGQGGGGFGGGGGAFSVAPEKAAKIDVPLLCLDHGKRVPSSSKPYELVRPEEHLESHPEVIELLSAFGAGQLQRGAAQAAVWHANSEVSWEELAAKLDGTARSTVRNPYFSRQELQAAVAYYQEATRRAAERAIEKAGEAAEESMADESRPSDADYLPQG